MDKINLSDLVITKVYSANTFFHDKNVRHKRDERPCWAVVIKFEGETEYTSNGKKIISNANNPAILPRGCSYEWICTKKGHYSLIEFDTPFTGDTILSFKIQNSDKILSLFKDIEYKRMLQRPFYELESIYGTYEILLKLFKSTGRYTVSDKRMKIQPAVDYIAKYYYKDIKNDELSEIAQISTVYFRKIFTEVFGVPPISYVHQTRIEKAKEMLLSDYSTISDIAEAVGYSSIYHFSKMFRKYTGVSPSKFIALTK